MGTDDFYGEVRSAEPERIVVFGIGCCQIDGNIWDAVIPFPTLNPIANVDTRKNVTEPCIADDFLKDARNSGYQLLVLLLALALRPYGDEIKQNKQAYQEEYLEQFSTGSWGT